MTENKVNFEDLIMEIMMEEDQPTPEALARWIAHYPKFRDRLNEFFTDWSLQETLAASLPPVQINEEEIVSRGVASAMDILRRQGRLIAKDAPTPALTTFDQIVLAAVFMFHGKGDAIAVTDRVQQLLGQDVLIATVLSALKRLEERHLVSAADSDPDSEPDAKSRRYFAITLFGERALAVAKETSRQVADFLGEFA
jgi:hypothetical protein